MPVFYFAKYEQLLVFLQVLLRFNRHFCKSKQNQLQTLKRKSLKDLAETTEAELNVERFLNKMLLDAWDTCGAQCGWYGRNHNVGAHFWPM